MAFKVNKSETKFCLLCQRFWIEESFQCTQHRLKNQWPKRFLFVPMHPFSDFTIKSSTQHYKVGATKALYVQSIFHGSCVVPECNSVIVSFSVKYFVDDKPRSTDGMYLSPKVLQQNKAKED